MSSSTSIRATCSVADPDRTDFLKGMHTDMTHGSVRSPFGLTRRRLLALGAAASAGAAFAWPVMAQTRVDVTQGNVAPLPIAIPDFVGGTPGDTEVARGITQVITANPRRSGLFAPIDPAAYIEKVVSFDTLPRFPDWRAINAQGLITGRVTRQGDG